MKIEELAQDLKSLSADLTGVRGRIETFEIAEDALFCGAFDFKILALREQQRLIEELIKHRVYQFGFLCSYDFDNKLTGYRASIVSDINYYEQKGASE